MSSNLMEDVFSGKIVAEYMEVRRNLQLQCTNALDDTLPMVERAQARAMVFVLEHMQVGLEKVISESDVRTLISPPEF